VPTARDVGQSSSCIQQWACGLPYPAAGRRSSPPVAFPACVSTHVPRRWIPGHCLPFCTPIRPRCRLTVQRRPTGAGCIPQPAIRGRSAIALPWSRSPCSHFPRPFCDVSVHHCWLCQSIDGVSASARNSVEGRLAIPRPIASDPTPIALVKGKHSGEIESLDRHPGIATLNLGMRFHGILYPYL